MPDHFDVRPSGLPQSTAVGAYEGIVPFSGIFDAILQNAAQRAYMETEGMYTATEEAFETAQRDLRDIQMTVPQDQQADALAEYLRNTGYSTHVVEQTLGIPREEVDAALMAAGYNYEGQPLPEEDVFADTTATTMIDLVPEVEGVVTDDPTDIWEKTDKDDLDLKGFIDLAFDIFGAYNKDAINSVVDLVNERGISVGDVAAATGNSVESINQAATESGTEIKNQNTGEITVDAGPAIGPQPPITVDEGPAIGPTQTPVDDTGDDEVVTVVDDTRPEVVTTPTFQVTPPEPQAFQGLFAQISPRIVNTTTTAPREIINPMTFELTNVNEYLTSGLLGRLS